MPQENIEVDVNLNGNAIVNGALQNLSSAPGSPVVGQLYFDTTLGTAREWNGSAWKNLDASTITDGSIPLSAIATTGTLTLATVNGNPTFTGDRIFNDYGGNQLLGLNGSSQLATIAPNTAGYVLTDNGAGNLPSFQAPPASGIANGTSLQTSASFNIDGTGEIGTTLLVGDSCNTISGVGSATFGKENAVTGDGVGGSVAIGRGNTVSGTQSFSTGNSNTSSGNYSFTAGEGNVAAGRDSIAMGSATTATNDNSLVLGDNSAETADSLARQFNTRFSNGYRSSTIPARRLDELNTGALSVLNDISAGGNLNVTGGSVNSSSIVNGASNTNTGFQVLNSGSTNVTSGTVSVALGTTANDGGFNGTFTFCDGTAPLTATAANQFNVRASGGIKFYDDATGTPAAAISGGNLAVTGNITAANLGSKASLQTEPAAPSSITTASTVMMGLAIPFTPAIGSSALIIISGNSNTAANNAQLQIAIGTGTAPSNGDAATGTGLGQTFDLQPVSACGYSLNGIASGLTPGTPIWVDIQANSNGTAALYLQRLNVSIIEL